MQIHTSQNFSDKLLHWAQTFKHVAYYDSCNYKNDKYGSYDKLVAVSNEAIQLNDQQNSFEQLKKAFNNKWLFGYFGYDLKNQVEKLSSNNYDGLDFPNIHFFEPTYLLIQQNNVWRIELADENSEHILEEIENTNILTIENQIELDIKERLEKETYLKTIEKIKTDIENGTYYEINFCKEFYSNKVEINPAVLFSKLLQQAKAPMSAFLKMDDKYLLCASPERFLKKEGTKVIAQPIKGTIKRSTDKASDEQLKSQLENSEKDRSENVMIVDLMRNDLTKTAKPGSIKVKELFGIYSFEKVHHMISTIISDAAEEFDSIDIIKNAFPMGSMTGAPKVKAMQIIEAYEKSKRGLYAGSVGYIQPNGDFDFNVVIRSMLYNASKKYLSFQTGGAIVYDSDAEQEFEETVLKAANILAVLKPNQ